MDHLPFTEDPQTIYSGAIHCLHSVTDAKKFRRVMINTDKRYHRQHYIYHIFKCEAHMDDFVAVGWSRFDTKYIIDSICFKKVGNFVKVDI